ncbi:integrase [Mesorhizobium sp. LNJC394B00]|nr:integrase [Mesorhizobium sp. LNJC394B00]
MLKGGQFDQPLILFFARWYLALHLSRYHLKEAMAERGIGRTA